METVEPSVHPCERVFGTCKSGDQCHYKDAPREACVSFLKGKCRFGNACRESHYISHEGRYISAFHPCLRVFEDCKFGDKCEYAQLPSTSCIKFLKGKCTFGTRCAEQHFGMFPGFGGGQLPFAMNPLQMQQQAQLMQTHAQQARARGGRQRAEGAGGGASANSNNNNNNNNSSNNSSNNSNNNNNNNTSGSSNNNNSNNDSSTASNTSSCTTASTDGNTSATNNKYPSSTNTTRVLVPSKRQQQVSGQIHPCVRVFGACIAGPTCKFATIPAEACLRHLKGNCKFGEGCAEIHFDTPDTQGGKHPCARIFGACQSSCRFADYPRECCLQFLKGKCKFGDQCREVHLQPEQTKEQ